MELNRVESHHATTLSLNGSSASGLVHDSQLLPTNRKRQTIVLISSFFTIFQTIGINQSYGVFQNYYTSSDGAILPSSQVDNKALIAFVGTLGAGLTWGGSIFTNPLMSRSKDHRWITVTGVFLMSLGLGLAGSSTEVSITIRNRSSKLRFSSWLVYAGHCIG
jgi:hypothetical protein